MVEEYVLDRNIRRVYRWDYGWAGDNFDKLKMILEDNQFEKVASGSVIHSYGEGGLKRTKIYVFWKLLIEDF